MGLSFFQGKEGLVAVKRDDETPLTKLKLKPMTLVELMSSTGSTPPSPVALSFYLINLYPFCQVSGVDPVQDYFKSEIENLSEDELRSKIFESFYGTSNIKIKNKKSFF